MKMFHSNNGNCNRKRLIDNSNIDNNWATYQIARRIEIVRLSFDDFSREERAEHLLPSPFLAKVLR